MSQKLLYRRQYVLSSFPISSIQGWLTDSFNFKNKNISLQYHPDLTYHREKVDSRELFILGYILDPANPGYDNCTILKNLLKNINYCDLVKALEKYNGRFVLIYKDQNNLNIVGDAVGFRQIYYFYTANGDFICGSTSNLISKLFNIPVTSDNNILSFYKSKEFKNSNHIWVGNQTLYDGIFQLLPNYYLDVPARKYVRYWPAEPITKIDADECAERCAGIIRGTFLSALNRYELHMGVTAGWDSRLLLSATRDFKDKIFYYVNKGPDHSTYLRDLEIPRKLSEKLGISINILEIDKEVDKKFSEIFFINEILARPQLMPIFYDAYKRKNDNKFTVSGTMGNGLARIYMRIPEGADLNGNSVAALSKLIGSSYAVERLNQWVIEVKSVCSDYKIDIMDLYQMEQENPHWASLASAEQDIVRDEIRPFNNQELIRLFWSLEDHYRFQYYPLIYIKIMNILWKEVTDIPLNPSLKSSLYDILRQVGMDQKIYYYFKKRKFLKLLHTRKSG